MPTEDSSALPDPPPVPDYELLRRIGRGSYGDVWLARSATGLFRAVKVVWRSRFGTDHTPYEREFNGLRQFARLTSGETRQLSLLHVGRNDETGFFYYVMDLADDVVTGREIDPNCYEPLTFRSFRQIDRTLPIPEVIRHAIELARGLAELHATGHLHRDIKPSNIIVVHGRAKLADIGLVAHRSDAATFVGTEGFMPPEGPGTAAADIYSFGKVLYELATGRDRHDFPRLPADFGRRSDHRELLELNEIILRACARDPAQRYPDVAALLADLQLLEAGRSVRRLRRAEAGLARARRWIAAAAAIAAVAGTGAYLERQRAEQESAARRTAEEQLAELTRRSLYESSIANAQRALASDEYGLARQALALGRPRPGEPDLRGFEWHVLHREAAGDPAQVIRETGARVDNLVLSPDGRLLAIDDASTSVEIHDLTTGRLVQTIAGIHRLAGFTPDGQRLAGTTPAYELETWSVTDGSPDPRPNPPGIFRPLAVAASTPRLLYFQDSTTAAPHRLAIRDLDTDRDLIAWDIPRREGSFVWDFHKATADAELHHVALLTVHGLGEFAQYHTQRWQLQDDRVVRTLSEIEAGQASLFSLSADGTRFIRGVRDTPPRWQIGQGPAGVWQEPLPTTAAATRAISPDGRWVAIGNRDRRGLVADFTTGRRQHEFTGHADMFTVVEWLPDSRRFLSGSRGGDVRLWSLDTLQGPPHRVTTAPIVQRTFNLHPLAELNGSRLFIPSAARLNFVFDPATGTLHPGRADVVTALLFDRGALWWIDDHQTVVRGALDPTAPPETVPVLPPGQKVREANVSPNGRWLTASDFEDRIVLWDRHTDTVSGQLTTPASTIGLTVDNAGDLIFVDFRQRLQKWNIRGPVPTRLIDRPFAYRPPRLLVSPDNRWLVVIGSTEGNLILHNTDLRQATRLEGTYAMTGAFTFHPDSRTLACIGALGTVRLFTLDHRERWAEHPPLVFATSPDAPGGMTAEQLLFSPDGNTLAAHLSDGVLRVWRK